jgi:ribose transport system substrate-binding protein
VTVGITYFVEGRWPLHFERTIMNRFVVAAGIVAGFALGAPAVAQTKPTIPVIVKATTSLYWQTVLAGARKAGQDLGVDVTGLGAQSESDIAGQISILQKAVASNPAAIVIAPAQFAALGKPIDEAAKKVKIIGIDSAADTKTLTSLVAVDEVQAGRIAADALANAITKTYADTEGNVAIITASPGASRDQSAEGFKEQVAKKYRALSVLPDKVADAQEATGFSIMKELTATDRNLRGVFVSNIVMAEGASQVIYNKSSGDKVNYVVFGSDDKLVKSLQDSTIAALVVRDPFRIGYDGVKTALAASRGEKVPASIDTGVNLITKANMNSARSQELLHPTIN